MMYLYIGLAWLDLTDQTAWIINAFSILSDNLIVNNHFIDFQSENEAKRSELEGESEANPQLMLIVSIMFLTISRTLYVKGMYRGGVVCLWLRC